MHKWIVLVLVLPLAAALCAGAAASPQPVSLTLDWTPNPDHIGFYYAQQEGLFAKAGLDVTIRAPSDPTAPLKLVAAGDTDLAVSYEPEMFYAAASKLPDVAVAAIVPQPLDSIMAIDPDIKTVADLKGKTIGITGVPSDYANLDTALSHAGLTRAEVKVVTVGYNLLPALLSHKVAAVLGVYRNVEGIEAAQQGFKPTIIPVNRAGVPFYDELVLVANANRLRTQPAYASMVGRFVSAFLAGTTDARAHPARSIAIMAKVTASSARFLDQATPATLALLSGPDGIGCMSVAQWSAFGRWMHVRKLVASTIPASAVMTTRFLPPRCGARS
jgi:putative hydroxymethylpyrimidine transport system substrate-binding protein